jgi:HK97 family phage prohead protease
LIEAQNLEIKAEVSIDDTGTVTGIAWPFGSPDSVGDVIEKGTIAFATSVPMVMEHDQKQVVGVWETYTETDSGLEVKGRLFVEGIGPARDAHRQLKAGRVAGLSIGFRHTGFDPRPAGGRVFKSITVNEISLCRSPVHPGAHVTVVKSQIEENMENAIENEPEAKADPVVTPEELKAIKARMDKLEAKANRPLAANSNHPAGENDNSEQKAFSSYLRTGYQDAPEGVKKALTVANDAPGYILAPEETSSEFIRNLVEFSPVRGIADVRSTGSHTVILPKRLTVTNAKWKGEAVASEASEPTFDQLEFSVKEMTTHVDVGNWLVEDASHDVEAEIRLALAEDFGAKEGLAFVNGSAALEPKGFMAESGIPTSSTATLRTLTPTR